MSLLTLGVGEGGFGAAGGGGPVGAALFDAAASSTPANGTSATQAVTVGNNSYRYIIAFAKSNGSGAQPPAPTGLTCGGNAMTAISGADSFTSADDSQSERFRTVAYYYQDPGTGSQTVIASYAGATDCSVGVVSVYNVNQTPASAFAGVVAGNNTAINGAFDLAITGIASGDLCLSDIYAGDFNGNGADVAQSETQTYEVAAYAWQGECSAGQWASASGTSKTMTHTITMSLGVAGVAFAVKGG